MVVSNSENLESEYYLDKGRRYNGNTRYFLPSDQKENARLFEQHFGIKIMRDDRNYLAPVKQQLEQGIQVLDSACGHGAPWTIDMANEYPKSKYFGVDISDGIPSKNKSPVNTSFFTGNISKSIPIADNTIDFAFQRLVVLALSNEEWNSNVKELFRILKPGGFIELLEVDYSYAYNAGPLFTMFLKRLHQVSQSNGVVLPVANELEVRLKKAGFINATSFVHEYPLNHGKNGISSWKTFREAVKAMGTTLATIFKDWEDDAVYDKFLDDVTKEFIEYKTSLKFNTAYAQKP